MASIIKCMGIAKGFLIFVSRSNPFELKPTYWDYVVRLLCVTEKTRIQKRIGNV